MIGWPFLRLPRYLTEEDWITCPPICAAAVHLERRLERPRQRDVQSVAAGMFFALGRCSSAGAMAAPAGYLYGMRGGRPSGVELEGIVVGGLVETFLIEVR